MVAEEGRVLRDFLEKSGDPVSESQATRIYAGPAPAIPGVFYPAWFEVGLATIVLKVESESKYVVSVRDAVGGVMQELTVAGGAGEFPADIRKKIYLPYSSIVYNQVHVRLVRRDASVADIPTFKQVAELPFAAKNVDDQRHFNLQVPIDVALQGVGIRSGKLRESFQGAMGTKADSIGIAIGDKAALKDRHDLSPPAVQIS